MTRSEYRESLASFGATHRERIIAKAIHDTNFLAPVSPSYKDVTIDDVPYKVNIISSTVTNQKIFHMMPGDDFTIGSIMYWSNSHWLITERDAEDTITVRGKIQICQKQIIWQDDTDHSIVSLWASVEKPYYSNLSENNYIGYSTREFRVKMPFDEYSARLNVGKRLMLEIIAGVPKTYRITSVDQMTGRIDYNNEQIGFLEFNVEQDLYNPEFDNMEKMICNYVPEDTDATTGDDDTGTTHTFDITINGQPTVVAGGYGKVYKASYDDVTVADDVEWALTGDIVPESVHFKNNGNSYTGAKCQVVCVNNSKLIGSTVTLTAKYQGLEKSVALEVVG